MPRLCPDLLGESEVRRLYQAMLRLLDKPAGLSAKVVVRPVPGPGLRLGEGCVLPLWMAKKYDLLGCIGATRAEQTRLVARAVVALNDAHDFDRDVAIRAGVGCYRRAEGYWDDDSGDPIGSLEEMAEAAGERHKAVAVARRLHGAMLACAEEAGDTPIGRRLRREADCATGYVRPAEVTEAAKVKPRRPAKRARKAG